jgi:hypothetical protein
VPLRLVGSEMCIRDRPTVIPGLTQTTVIPGLTRDPSPLDLPPCAKTNTWTPDQVRGDRGDVTSRVTKVLITYRATKVLITYRATKVRITYRVTSM